MKLKNLNQLLKKNIIMKRIKKKHITISLLFSVIMFFVSCVAYKSTTLTLDDLVKSEERVRIEYSNSEIYRFKKIIFENGNYYGLMKEELKLVKKEISIEEINSIKTYDKTKSIIITIGVPIVLVGLVYIIGVNTMSVGVGL